MKKKCIDFFCCFLAISILFAGCTSTTLIRSNPSKAKVYIDGSYVGETPYTYSDTKIVGGSFTLSLEKDGYKPLMTTVTRDEQVDVGAVVGGVFFWFPFLWTMEYKPLHSYELKSTDGDAAVESAKIQDAHKSTADKLREMKQLLDEGIITQGEFDKSKAKILDAD